eukprot:TRINITY_DN1010_c0_g1_i1.p1 TRINITY_DN1010_c0_g1~~TRINITY_DN1010_c0_g1_i1.p1  ORF type:complete len:461 (+),score=165.18 TRINITY_DN1010_c0_g1_i1:129-1385(+)
MATLYVDDSFLSKAAKALASVANPSAKIVTSDDQVKNSAEFKTASPKGEVPALSGVTGTTVDVLKALVQNDATLLGSESQKKEVDKLLTFAVKDFAPLASKIDNRFIAKVHKFNKDLATTTFFVGHSFTAVDIIFFVALHPVVKGWSEAERVDFLNVTRWFDFVQHRISLPDYPLIEINKNVTVQPKEDKPKKEAPKKEAAAAPKADAPKKDTPDEQKPQEPAKQAASTEKKDEKKQRQPSAKQAAAAAKAELPVDVSRLNIRVGKIVAVKKHEEADSLYVEQIDVGEEKPRTVVSGLVKFVPIEEMQDRMVLVMANLKPAKLKGILSEAMVLAASNEDHTKVELLTVPEGTKVGERVTFEGFPGEADAQLNPKHKVWEAVQPDLKTNGELVATYKGAAFKTSAGVCTVKSIANGTIK